MLRQFYFISVIFATAPIYSKQNFKSDQNQNTESKKKFIRVPSLLISTIWIAMISKWFIEDYAVLYEFGPYEFFSKKILEKFPNDFYCLRLVLYVETLFVLYNNLLSSRNTFQIINNQSNESNESNDAYYRCNKRMFAYSFIASTAPIISEWILIWNSNIVTNPQRLLQSVLNYIPFTVDIQFSSICIFLYYEIHNLEKRIRETRTPRGMHQVIGRYFSICRLMRKIVKDFELHLFVEVGIVCFHLLLNLYHLFNMSNSNHFGAGDLLHSGFWTIHYTSRLFITCIYASKMTKRFKETRSVLIEFEDHKQCEELNEQVVMFIERINVQDLTINIGGFFDFDTNLLLSISGWCISSLLILLQFRTPRSKKE